LATFITADTAETSKTYNDASVFSFWGLYKMENTDEYAIHWIDCLEIRVEPKDLEDEFMQFYFKCCGHPVKPRLAVIEKKSTGVTLASSISKIRGLTVKALDHNSTSGSKTERFLAMQPYVASKLVSLTKGARHVEHVVEHMRKITANNSHRFDDIADTAQMAVEVALIEKSVRNYIMRQSDGQSKATAVKIMANFKKIVNLRKSRDG
jgi:predicted phage terminase large subunit-like protein